jgi:hypothetical protein
MPDTWTYLKVAISKANGTDIEFGARIEDVDINEGDRPAKSIPSTDGSCLLLDEPQEMGEITLRNLKPIHIDPSTGAGGLAQAYIGGTWDTTDPYQTPIASTLYRDDFRCAVLMTDDTANTSAAGAVTATKAGYRFHAVHCRITSLSCSGGAGKPFTETVTLKFSPISIDGARNYQKAATKTDGAGITALASYTGADLS